MPFASGTYFNNTLIFGNCPENQTGIARIITSADGLTWNTLYSANVTSADVRWNLFTTHPRGSIFGTMKTGYSYQIKDIPPAPPPPPPTPEPTVTPTPPSPTDPTMPTYSPNPAPSSTTYTITIPLSTNPTPSPKPKPTSTPQTTTTATPTPKPTSTPPAPTLTTIANSPSIEVYVPWIFFVVLVTGSLLFAALLKKSHKRQ
jgi:hypothetical protein